MSENYKKDLHDYYEIQQRLDAVGGPDRDAALFERLIVLQEDILASYGLPPAQKHIKKLWKFATRPFSEDSVSKTIGALQRAAEKHLLSPVSTPVDILEQAKEDKESAFDVLPELGFITHDYSIFIYQELLLQNKAPATEVLAELEKVHQLDCYAELYHLKHTPEPDFNVEEVFEKLNHELRFLQHYLHSPDTLLSDRTDETEEDDLLGPLQQPYPAYYEPEPVYELIKAPFEVQEIVFSHDSGTTLFGHFRHEPSRQLMLGCDHHQLTGLLKLYPLGQTLLPELQRSTNSTETDEPVIIDFKNKYGTNLLFTEHYLEVYQYDAADGGLPENFYVLSEAIPKKQHEAKVKARKQLQQLCTRYGSFLKLLKQGVDKTEARSQTNLKDDELFATAQLLHQLVQSGGEINL